MAVPFGFSIGDFIAVGDLAQRIIKALDESFGAVADYKALCSTLLSLHKSLHTASAIFLYSSSSSTRGPLDTPPLNGVRHELERCRGLMEEFLASSKKYMETPLNGAKGRRFMKEWRKMTWSLYKTEDAQKLQVGLQGHLDAFNLYTSAIIMQRIYP